MTNYEKIKQMTVQEAITRIDLLIGSEKLFIKISTTSVIGVDRL